jgi:hypothetical protein
LSRRYVELVKSFRQRNGTGELLQFPGLLKAVSDTLRRFDTSGTLKLERFINKVQSADDGVPLGQLPPQR